MAERVLVPYDATPCADQAVEYALRLAQEWNASLYVVALAPANADTHPRSSQLMDDLVAFAHLGRRLGIDVDGSFLDTPDQGVLKQLIASHRIDHLVVALCNDTAPNANAQLLRALAENSPVPVTTLEVSGR